MPAVSGIPTSTRLKRCLWLLEFVRFAEIIADVGLGADPIDYNVNSPLPARPAVVTGRTDFLCVACEMSHFRREKFAPRSFDVDLKGGGNDFRQLCDRYVSRCQHLPTCVS